MSDHGLDLTGYDHLHIDFWRLPEISSYRRAQLASAHLAFCQAKKDQYWFYDHYAHGGTSPKTFVTHITQQAATAICSLADSLGKGATIFLVDIITPNGNIVCEEFNFAKPYSRDDEAIAEALLETFGTLSGSPLRPYSKLLERAFQPS